MLNLIAYQVAVYCTKEVQYVYHPLLTWFRTGHITFWPSAVNVRLTTKPSSCVLIKYLDMVFFGYASWGENRVYSKASTC